MIAADQVPVVAVALVSSSADRKLIDAWAGSADAAKGLTEVLLAEDDLGARLAAYDEALVVPIKVSWLPHTDGERRNSRLSELGIIATPRRPAQWIQRRLAGFGPVSEQVVVGEPALLSALRTRFDDRIGSGGHDDADFARFVRRAAVLTLDRTVRSHIGDRFKVPHAVTEEILSQSRFRSELHQVAGSMGLSQGEARTRAEEALGEVVAVQSRTAVEMFRAMLAPFHEGAWKVEADTRRLDELRDLNSRHALVFLPSHRSYVDPLVIGDVLDRSDFPRNHIMAGGNLRIWPFADLARRAGIVFIRRDFGEDKIYKLAVEEYIGYLLSKRFNLEWYFEGGRSRTGKLRPPKYGLMRYVADAVIKGRVDTAYLVPVSITYDRLYEVSTMAAEQVGGKKQPEGLKWMAGYLRSQRRASGGRAYVRFGTPIDLAPRLAPAGASAAEDRLALQKVVFEVAVGINAVTPVTPNSLLTLALLGVRGESLTLDHIVAIVAPVLDYIEARDLPITGSHNLRTREGVAQILAELGRAKVVSSYSGGTEPVYAIADGQHLVAAFYRNNSIHWFVNRAITELGILYGAQHSDISPTGAGWREINRLRDLLKFEFFFPDRATFRRQIAEEIRILLPEGMRTTHGEQPILDVLRRSGMLVAHRVLRSFVDAQLVVADRLAVQDPGREIDRDAFLESCGAVGKQMLLQGRLHGPESLSNELFTSAIELMKNKGLWAAPDDPARVNQLRAEREDFARYLQQLGERISLIETLDATNRAEVTGVTT